MPKGIFKRTKEHCKKISKAHKGMKKPWARFSINLFTKGHGGYWLGKKRPPFSKEMRNKMSKAKIGIKGIRHPRWKGDEVGYGALHSWVHRELGKTKRCEHCGKTNNVDWANKSRRYLRKLDDWWSLCRSCHVKYDKHGFYGK